MASMDFNGWASILHLGISPDLCRFTSILQVAILRGPLDFDRFCEFTLFFICSFSSQGGVSALGWIFGVGMGLWRWGGTLALEWYFGAGVNFSAGVGGLISYL